METEKIIADIISGDVARIRVGTSKIISVSQDREMILLFKDFRQLIADKTAGIEKGGAFASNKRFVDYTLKVIDFHVAGNQCPCALYSDFAYYDIDPQLEHEKKNVVINEIVRVENNYISHYFCACLKCGQKFKVFERTAHFTTWDWIKTEENPSGKGISFEDYLISLLPKPAPEAPQKVPIPIELQKEGYLDLIDLCLGENKKSELTQFIKTLKDYNGDYNFYTTLNFVTNYLDTNGIHFIMVLDWKQEVSDLKWRIDSSLRDNFNITVDLPDPAIYGDRASISTKNVLSDFDTALRNHNFKISFIDTESDEYIIIIHFVQDEKLVAEAVRKTGYRYAHINPETKKFEDLS